MKPTAEKGLNTLLLFAYAIDVAIFVTELTVFKSGKPGM